MATRKKTQAVKAAQRKTKGTAKGKAPRAEPDAAAPAAEIGTVASTEMLSYLSRGRASGEVVHVLRACRADMSAYNDFVWPVSGPVEAPDWKKQAECGHGLHGWLLGQGDSSVCGWVDDSTAKWLVYAAWSTDVVDLSGKIKCPRAWVLFCGTRDEAVAEMRRLGASGVMYSTLTGGDGSTLTGGYGSTLTGGARSTLTGGDGSTLTGGDGSTLTGGDGSTLTGGYGSTLTGGARSTLTGGDGSTLTGGDGSTLTGGYGSTLTGGENGCIAVLRWNGKLHVAYVGEEGIEAGVAYRMDEAGAWVRADGKAKS